MYLQWQHYNCKQSAAPSKKKVRVTPSGRSSDPLAESATTSFYTSSNQASPSRHSSRGRRTSGASAMSPQRARQVSEPRSSFGRSTRSSLTGKKEDNFSSTPMTKQKVKAAAAPAASAGKSSAFKLLLRFHRTNLSAFFLCLYFSCSHCLLHCRFCEGLNAQRQGQGLLLRCCLPRCF